MGLFNRIRATIGQHNYGAKIYYKTEWAVEKYFANEGDSPIIKTKGGELEAMLLHAAMIKILIMKKFPNNVSELYKQYLEILTDNIYISHKHEFQKINGYELNADFIFTRIDYYERRWIALLTQKEKWLDDVYYLLYRAPLTSQPEEGANRKSYLNGIESCITLYVSMGSTFQAINEVFPNP